MFSLYILQGISGCAAHPVSDFGLDCTCAMTFMHAQYTVVGAASYIVMDNPKFDPAQL